LKIIIVLISNLKLIYPSIRTIIIREHLIGNQHR